MFSENQNYTTTKKQTLQKIFNKFFFLPEIMVSTQDDSVTLKIITTIMICSLSLQTGYMKFKEKE